MCGIAGFYQTKYNVANEQTYYYLKQKLLRQKNSIIKRGPDEQNVTLNSMPNPCNEINDLFPISILGGFTGFAHTRLSIRDVHNGSQPMTCKYRERKASIVYNGEIYNVNYLKNKLLPFHVNFKTTSDTEVLLYCYLIFGTSIFKELNGIFAFAIYDSGNLILVRDHIGVKPLFYYHSKKEFVFSSEIKGIFAYGIDPKAGNDSWCEIIGLGPAHTLGKGVFEEINEVLPGHYLVVSMTDKKNIYYNDYEYWKLENREHTDDYKTTVDYCSFLIEDSIKKQMVSDVPICTFLSGGIDSSLVSAIVASNLTDKKLTAYSFDFVGNEQNFVANSFQSSRDNPYVDIMTKHIDCNTKYLYCTNEDQIRCLYKAVDARDMPCMADVESSMLYFCNKVSEECKVALTGECADEIFGGYPWFHRKEMLECNKFPWSGDLSPRTALFKEDFINSLNIEQYVNNEYELSISECPVINSNSLTEQNRRKISWLNVRWFMLTLLNRMDRCSMYSGLEARVPFADYRILEYVFNIPWEYKCYKGQTKSLLVECGKKYLPPEVLYRKKSPYPKTYDPNYEKMLSDIITEIINNNEPLSNIIDKNKLDTFLSSPKDYGKPWYGQLMAGPQMIAYLIQINYWMKKYKIAA